MPAATENVTLFEIFAGRAAAELRRLRAERDVRERESELTGLVESAMDAIVQLDDRLQVVRMNPAAERTFELSERDVVGADLSRLLRGEDRAKIEGLAAELASRPPHDRSSWVPGGLTGQTAKGTAFPAEATLSLFELHRRRRFTLILRNVNERLEAERRIRSLTDETEYLRAELRELGRSGEIIGRSEGLVQVLHDLRQVGPRDHDRSHSGRNRNRQGAVRSRAPRRKRPSRSTARESELRSHPCGAHRKRVLRTRARRLHRSDRQT